MKNVIWASRSTNGKNRRDDDHREAVGDDHVDGHRGDAAAELLRDHGRSGRCGTDDADEHTLEHYLHIGREMGHEQNGHHDETRQRSAHQLQQEMPRTRVEVVKVDLTERHVQHDEDDHRQQVNELRSNEGAHRLQQGDVSKGQVDHSSHTERHQQRPVLHKRQHPATG